MKRLIQAGVYVFAVIGVLLTVGVGYAYATNGELMGEFWAVKDDFQAVPADRKTEVVAELPARITFEKEVAAEMAELPEERRTELYTQLKESRDKVYAQFKERITAEAELTRKMKAASKPAAEMAKEIEKELGKVDVGIDLTGKGKKPAVNNLAAVEDADDEVSDARSAYGETLDSGKKDTRLNAAIAVYEALDKLGEKGLAAAKSKLSSAEEAKLKRILKDAKLTWSDVKATPGLAESDKGKKAQASSIDKINAGLKQLE
jgi:hypothetical protein